ncbi:DUF5060 domain-containing protein [Corallincola spongiicola]|nr:DUF5060 domain-containing protein [Corallincola spongiicola]
MQADADQDGIIDNVDSCLNTPAGMTVDSEGCEIVPDDTVGDDEDTVGDDDDTVGDDDDTVGDDDDTVGDDDDTVGDDDDTVGDDDDTVGDDDDTVGDDDDTVGDDDNEVIAEVCTEIKAVDFARYADITGFANATKDTKAGLELLQIAESGATAAAQQTYTGIDSDVIFKLHTIQEADGEPSYVLKVNGASVGQATNTRIHGTDTPEYSLETHVLNSAFFSLQTNDFIQLEFTNHANGLVMNGDVADSARARWFSLDICTEGADQDSDGVADAVDQCPNTPEGSVVDSDGCVELPAAGGDEVITGELRQWHKVTISFNGPEVAETDTINPFTDYRMDVTFSNGDSRYVVPGFFAADGDAANSAADEGNQWRVHFSPDKVGEWKYEVSFRTGENVALNANALAGQSGGDIDGVSGVFVVADSDKTGRDFRGKGRLQYVGERYLRFAESGEYFLKQGSDSPENLLAYADFDGDFKSDNHKDDKIKTWQPHVADWNNGDPTWQDDKGKGLIGAVNYLVSEGQNVISFLTMNIEGDDQNVFPYTDYDERYRFDVSRLAQWDVVFSHMQNNGIFLHFKTQETENDHLLDNGELGAQRKLYYRELIARFGYHLALNWNLGEENTQSTQQVQDMASYFAANDPYQHPVVLHTYPGQKDQVYGPLLGDQSDLHGASMQMGQADFSDVHSQVLEWIRRSEDTGKAWIISVDEPGDAKFALRPDDNAGDSQIDGRKNGVWGTLMAGGAGNEWYFGYDYAHSDLTLEDFRSRDAWWDVTRYSLEFFKNNNVPFWDMVNDNSISSAENDYGFYKANDTYVVYLKQGGSTELDLNGVSGTYEVVWFDPRNGGELQQGSVTGVVGGGFVDLGEPPQEPSSDWVVLVRRDDDLVIPPVVPPVDPDEDLYVDVDGLVIIEAEHTTDALGEWIVKQAVAGYTGSGHVEFTGPNSYSAPQSAISYRFKVSQPGDYQLYIRAHKRLDGEAADKNNDAFFRLEGDFEASTSHEKNAALALLKNDTKIFGGSATGWGWATQLNPKHGEFYNPVYKLKADTEYRFVMSGRSTKFNVDRFIFRHSSVGVATAKDPSLPETLQ